MKVNNLLLGIIIILSTLFCIREFQNSKKIEDVNAKLSTYVLKNQALEDSILNKDKQIVKLQEAVIFEGKKGKEALSKYADSVFKLRKKDERKYKETVAYYENYIRTHVPDSVYIPYIAGNSGVGKDTLEYLKNSIRVPTSFDKKDDSYFRIKGTVQKDGVVINSISLPDTIRGRFVEKRNGLFKANTIEYQVFNTNPYIKIENSKSAIYTPTKEKNKLIKTVTGILIGIVIGLSIK